jgi:hypothetical protein
MATRSKVSKADKKNRRAARDREQEKLVEFVTEMTARLIVSHSAADVLGGITAEERHGLQHSRPLVDAAAAMWKRARPDHELTATLGELAAALARQDEILKQLVGRFEKLIDAPEVEIQPTAEDVDGIRDAIVADQHHDHG